MLGSSDVIAAEMEKVADLIMGQKKALQYSQTGSERGVMWLGAPRVRQPVPSCTINGRMTYYTFLS